ncbi:MAG: phosphoglycerate kinase [Nitrososphaerales archaeon]
MRILTLDDLDTTSKTIFLRVDMNVPIHPQKLDIIEASRINEASVTIRDLNNAKVVVGSHQGRVGRYDYIGMQQHAVVLEKILGKRVDYVEDVIGPEARRRILAMNDGDVLILDNLRFCAEENYEFKPPDAANTVMVKRLRAMFDLCVLDCFPSAHRAHPSIVGFPYVLPACAGRLVAGEVESLDNILTVAKAPFVVLLGGAKISDRLEAIDTLIQSGRADQVLLTGLISNLFLSAQGKMKRNRNVVREEFLIEKAQKLLMKYPSVFTLPLDFAVEKNGKRLEKDISDLDENDVVLDIGHKTVESYSKIIKGAGTVFMSGPAGAFERPDYSFGTENLLKAVASSLSTTIVSGGHLTAALQKFGLSEHVDHVSTAGGALVLYLAGKRLPMIEVLEMACERDGKKKV